MDLGLKDKVVCITGGSKGIGLASADVFAREGARVIICARRAERLAAAAESVRNSTGMAIDTVQADVTRLDSIAALFSTIDEQFGRLDILVNNAGTGTYKAFMDVSDDELMDGMAINFFAQFRVAQKAVPLMRRCGGGAIVNVSGRTATKTNYPPGSTCTGPAKAAEVRFSSDLGNELAQFNIRVNCVIPGVVETPDRFRKWEKEAVGGKVDPQSEEKVRRALEERSMGRRWGEPEEIANVVAFLASPRASYVNAASIIVDGGSLTKSYVTELYSHKDAIEGVLTPR
ncbi:MAG: SDR family oxidoreductase [Candidimonas sp.]|nr:MAG: SDR family oxidoreductase [Candidimonas sp.]